MILIHPIYTQDMIKLWLEIHSFFVKNFFRNWLKNCKVLNENKIMWTNYFNHYHKLIWISKYVGKGYSQWNCYLYYSIVLCVPCYMFSFMLWMCAKYWNNWAAISSYSFEIKFCNSRQTNLARSLSQAKSHFSFLSSLCKVWACKSIYLPPYKTG